MGFSSECLYCFHYLDSLGYLIFCCHGVAKRYPDWRNNPTNEEENFRIGVAVSDKPTGPFKELEMCIRDSSYDRIDVFFHNVII